MSMRKSTRQELRKSREVLRFLLRDEKCYFCKKPLIREDSYCKDGDGQGSPIKNGHGLPTIHHKDGNHDNDAPENKALAHDKCHRRFHAILRALLVRDMKLSKAIIVAERKFLPLKVQLQRIEK